MNRYILTLLSRTIFWILLAGWPSTFCWAQSPSALQGASPKLKQFLADHPTASRSLSTALSEAFAARTLQIYYFYSDDESLARANHTCPTKASVVISIRENQLPCDECSCLLFEILNSEGDERFYQLYDMAKAGTISKVDFATEMLRQEFNSVKKTRDSIGNWGLNQKEMAESYDYNRLIHCPNEFDNFMSYIAKVSPKRHAFEDYETYYDSLNNPASPAKMQAKFTSPQISPTVSTNAASIAPYKQ